MRPEMTLNCGTVVRYNVETDDFQVETPNGTFIFTVNNNQLSVFSPNAVMVMVAENDKDEVLSVSKIPNAEFTQDDTLVISLESPSPDDD